MRAVVLPASSGLRNRVTCAVWVCIALNFALTARAANIVLRAPSLARSNGFSRMSGM